MATYKHGVYTSEQATSMTAPVTGTAGLQVVVGTAPVNMLEHPEQAVNTPLLAYNYKEAVAAVGYHDDFAAYTLCESISAAFSVVGTGPLVLINVLDPAKHTADIAETTVQVNSGVAVLDVVGVLLDKLTVKSGSTALTRDTDYTASFNNDGTLNIVPLAGGKAASATTLTVTGKKLDPSKVKAADIVGGVDAATGKETGLEVVRQIYPKLSMTPGILLAPRFSMDATVAAALQAKTKEINGVFKAVCIVDIDSTASGATKYTDVKQRKEAQAVSDANAYAVWPCAKVGEVVDTMTSGRVVPMDTTVAPMSSSGTWKRRAMPVAPSTNQSPPLMRHSRPTMNSKTGMSINFFSFCFWQNSNKKETFITACPEMGKCNKSLKLPVLQRAFLPGCRCSTAHPFFN